LPIAGKAIVSHLAESLPEDVELIISTNEQFEKSFKDWKNKHFPLRNIKILVEPAKSEKDKKGAVGAISYAIDSHKIDDDVLVLAGDNLFTFDLSDFASKFNGNGMVAVYDLDDIEEAKKFGVVEIKNGKIVGFEEKPMDPKSKTVSTLCYVLPKESIPYLREFAKTGKDNAGDFIKHLIEETPFDVEPYVFSGSWFDIGSFEAYMEANKNLQKAPLIHETAKVIDSKITGSTVIGENCLIENSVIKDSIIMENCKIVDSEINESVVDFESSIKDANLEKQLIRNNTII
ncbi:NDP-sugar synthase, partial [bacterium]|nr:NDP-sugar synthase [bacterium]